MINNTLHLNVTRKWFDMIMSGEKPEEYRSMSPYWNKRLVNAIKRGIDTITFSNGYSKNRPYMIVQFKGMEVGTGREEWGGRTGKVV